MGDDCHNKKLSQVFLLLALAAANTLVVVVHGRGTHVGFYNQTCPCAESIVRATVEAHFRFKPSVAAGLLRMHFHDCFVRGCDASILISGPHTEQASPANADLNGFEVINDAKKHLEAACPGVVSCADILALAARDSVVVSGGESWKVPTGRRDGRVSKKSEPPNNLPGPDEPVAVLKLKFAKKGLNTEDLVALSGGHTIGSAGCSTLSSRLMGNGSDPSINPEFLPKLKKLCPPNEPYRRVGLNTGSHLKFDTSYFENIRQGRGILRSDQALWSDNSTRPFVHAFLASHVFNLHFGKSMIKMSKIGLKTGVHGEIRKKCYAVN